MTHRVLRCALLGAALLTAGGASAQDLVLTPPDGVSASFRNAIGDVNRDGAKDYVVSGGFGGTPSVLVYDGKTGDLLHDLRDPQGDSRSQYGFDIAVGDVNADWFADVVVGAPGANGSEGAVYVFSGRTGDLMMTLASPNAEAGGRFGISVNVSNVIGYFVSDILVGASSETVDGVASAGRAYVFLGSYFSRYRGLLAATLESPTPTRFGAFGFRLEAADFDRDWQGDPVVAATFETTEGRAYVFEGGFHALREGRLLATITPPEVEYDLDRLFDVPSGILSMATGDFDGDHRPDLALGLPEAGVTGDQAGAGVVYVYTNPDADAPAYTLTSPGAVPTDSDDPVGGGGFGRGLSAADLNANGRAELVAGASSEDGEGGFGDGVAYVFDGRDGSMLRRIDAPAPSQPAPFRSFGFDTAAARDHKGTRLLVTDAGANESYVYLQPLAGEGEQPMPQAQARIVAEAETEGVDPTTRLRVPTFTAEDVASDDAEAQDALAVGLSVLADEAGESALAIAPNPSAGRAQASFTLAEAVEGRVAVYDVLGREVAVLTQGTLAARAHTLTVEGLAPGAYVVRLEAEGQAQTVRLTVVR